MKYLMLMLFSIVYMGSVAYGSSDCQNKARSAAFSTAGAFTKASSIDKSAQGSK